MAIEACYGWYWAVDVLQAEGAKVHLVHPSGMNWEERRVKNDYRDCCDLLDRLRIDRLPEAWIAPPKTRELRELVRYRAKLVALRTGLKAQVKALLAKHGLHAPVNELWGPTGKEYLDELILDRGYTVKLESLRDLVEIYDREVAMLEREIHGWLRDDVGYQAIQAINGVGKTMAAIFVAEIGDISRFPSPDRLCSCVSAQGPTSWQKRPSSSTTQRSSGMIFAIHSPACILPLQSPECNALDCLFCYRGRLTSPSARESHSIRIEKDAKLMLAYVDD